MAVEFRCESCGKLLAADGDCRQVDCPRCNSASEVPASLAPAGHSQQPSEPLADPQQEQRSPALSTGFMSRVMPVMISLLFHVGLLVVVVFLGAMLTIGETEREIVVHGVRRSPNPGGSLTPSPRNTVSEAAVEKVSTTVRESALMSAGGAAPSTWEARGPSTAEFYSSFFGSGSNAKHVVYVVDYTGSMYDVFDRVSFELANSIGQLDEKQTFHVILFHGSGDTTTPFAGAKAFHRAMLDAGNRCELVVTEGAVHGYIMKSRPIFDETMERIDKFLAELDLLPKPADSKTRQAAVPE